ncbi:MAG: hypothetical protein AB8E82_18455 [Aureispira sp.]
MNNFSQIPFDTKLELAHQIELIYRAEYLEVVAYVYNWWSKVVTISITLLGVGCILMGITLCLEIFTSESMADIYYSFSGGLGLFVIGFYGIANAGKLTQSRLKFLMFTDYFTIKQSLLLSEQGQNYAYEDILSIYKTTALRIATLKQQYTREWGVFLTKEQLEYLEQALRLVGKQDNRSTGAEEDWSNHLIE